MLLHLLDVHSPDPDIDACAQAVLDAQAIVRELERYSPDLAAKPRWLVLNKLDMGEDPIAVQDRICRELGWTGPVFGISALTGQGTAALTGALQSWLDEQQRRAHAHDEDPRFTRGDADAGAGPDAPYDGDPDDPRFAR